MQHEGDVFQHHPRRAALVQQPEHMADEARALAADPRRRSRLAQILARETCDDGVDLRWQIRQIDDIARERHIGVSRGQDGARGPQISQSIEVRCPAEAIPSSKPPIPAKSPTTSIPKLSLEYRLISKFTYCSRRGKFDIALFRIKSGAGCTAGLDPRD